MSQMYQPLLLQMNDFMGHKESIIEDFSGATMLYGINNTDEGQGSNGSGKSAIEEAIALVLTGNTLRKSSAKDLVRRGEKQSILDFVFGDQDEIIRVRRIIYSNTKSAELMIKVNDVTPPDLVVNAEDKVDVRDGNAWILNKIGVSREDLLDFFIVSKEKYKSFLTSSDTNKKAVVDRFSNSKMVDPVFDILSERETEIQSNIRSLEESVISNNAKIEVHQETQLEDTEELFLEQKKRSIQRIEGSIIFDKEQRDEFNKKILIKGDLVEGYEKALKDIPKITKLELDLKNISEEVDGQIKSHNKIQENLNEVSEMSSKLKLKIVGIIECPKCKHNFIKGKDVDIDETRETIKECGEMISELEISIADSRTSGAANRAKQTELSNKINEVSKKKRQITRDIESVNADIKSLFNKVDRAENTIAENEERLVKAKAKMYEPDETIEGKIDLLNKGTVKLNKSIEDEKLDLVKVLEQINYMKKFKAHLANKAIKAIEVMANNYLKLMKTNLSLNIEGFKINKNKKIVEKITCHVLRDGVPEGTFDRFSTGEKCRIESAMIMALQKIINKNTKGLDLCFLDEVLDGLDSDGIRGVLKMFKELDQNIIIITHGTVDQQVDKFITVVKEKGISSIM